MFVRPIRQLFVETLISWIIATMLQAIWIVVQDQSSPFVDKIRLKKFERKGQ